MSFLESNMLEMLKVDLGITTSAYDTRLLQCIAAAKEQIIREGVSDLNDDSVSDMNMVLMYASWTWRRRDSMDGMPRMLRWVLNNRIMSVKAR